MISRAELTMAIAATVIALVMHAVFITHAAALWRDEINSVATAQVPWSELWKFVEFESFPPLFDLLVRGWIAFGGGTSDTALRIAGSVGGVVLLGAVWFASWRLGRALPVVTLSLLAVNPEIIRWGASLRAWSLGAAAGLLVIVFTRDAAYLPSRRAFLTATAVAVLAVQLVYQNVILLAVVLACVAAQGVWRLDWPRLQRLFVIGAAALVSLLPYVGFVLRRSQWQGLVATPVTVGELEGKLWELLSASGPLVSLVWVALPFAAIVLTLRSRWNRTARIYLLSVAGFGTVALGLFYLTFRYPTQRWYYLPLAPLVAVTAEAILALDRRADFVRKARIAVAAMVLLAGSVTAMRALRVHQTTMDVIAKIVSADAVPGDVIVVSPWYYGVSFTHYYRGDVEAFTIPPLADMSVHRYDLLKRAMVEHDPIKTLLERIERSLTTGNSVWIVGAVERPPPGSPMSGPGPPPLPHTRWNSTPYEEAWIREVGRFLAAHTTSSRLIPTRVTAQPFEAPTVAVMKGWK